MEAKSVIKNYFTSQRIIFMTAVHTYNSYIFRIIKRKNDIFQFHNIPQMFDASGKY